MALVHPRPGMRVVDLGCGTGELTRDLHTHLAARDTLGLDSSPAMLAKAAASLDDETEARLREELDRMADSEDDPETYLEADYEFHMEICKAAHNRLLDRVMYSCRWLLATGLDPDVIEWLESHPVVSAMLDDIRGFLERWLPECERSSRSYITVAIGCTGGCHRSVYLVERLAAHPGEADLRVDLDHPEAPVQPHLDLVRAQPEADLDHPVRVAFNSDHPARTHVPERGLDRPLAGRSRQLVGRRCAGRAELFVEAAQLKVL
jgi:SAM-dependent methyltransferase